MPISRCWLFQPFPALDVTGMMVYTWGIIPKWTGPKEEKPKDEPKPKEPMEPNQLGLVLLCCP